MTSMLLHEAIPTSSNLDLISPGTFSLPSKWGKTEANKVWSVTLYSGGYECPQALNMLIIQFSNPDR